MTTIEEVKEKIETYKCIADLPRLYFAGKIGDKTHVGSVYLDIDNNGKLGLCCADVSCGSKKWGGREPNASNLRGKVLITCKRCGGEKVVDLDERNAEYKEIIPLIGTKI